MLSLALASLLLLHCPILQLKGNKREEGSPQIAANTGKLLHDCIGQVQGGYCSEELLKPNLCLLWVIAVVNAFVDFPDCEDADCNSLFGEGR